jgi:pimeloyl-ACP methyl ester carboxylesterase
MTETLPRPVIFITGTFLGNNCWDEWILYFESKGYQCIAPSWPYKEAPPEELRNRQPDPAIASNRLAALTDHFAAIIHTLPEMPVMIGHSLGGLIVQLLVQRGLGTAGVALHSFPPSGTGRFNFSFLKTWWEAIGLFTSSRDSYLMPFEKWNEVMANGMTSEQQKEWYYKYAIPESKLVIRDTFTDMGKINFSNAHAPLLFISGSDDRIIPASLNYDNYKRYKMGNSVTGYRDFKSSNHLVFDQPAWKEEADFILYWLQDMK